jgi:hypothetical protein
VWLKAGSGWSAGKFNVDAFVFAATTPMTSVLYDFEPPTFMSPSRCKQAPADEDQ